jgi:ketosteroid isomerase-like protein
MPDTDRRDILALLRAQEDAVARGDAAGVVAPLSSNLVTYDLPPPLEYRGARGPYAEGLEQWFATWNGPVTVKLADPTVVVEGDLAVVFGLSRMRGYKKEGGPFDGWNRRTIVLSRTEGTWRIIHEHSSYPLEMDGSGRAATNLQPQHDARGTP